MEKTHPYTSGEEIISTLIEKLPNKIPSSTTQK